MVKNSGDSSEQLSTLNEQLMAKDRWEKSGSNGCLMVLYFTIFCRQLQESQNALSEANMQISKLTETVETENQKRSKEMENLKEKHEQEMNELQGKIKKAVRFLISRVFIVFVHFLS